MWLCDIVAFCRKLVVLSGVDGWVVEVANFVSDYEGLCINSNKRLLAHK